MNSTEIHVAIRDLEVSLFKLDLVSQEGVLEGAQVSYTFVFYNALVRYWEPASKRKGPLEL